MIFNFFLLRESENDLLAYFFQSFRGRNDNFSEVRTGTLFLLITRMLPPNVNQCLHRPSKTHGLGETHGLTALPPNLMVNQKALNLVHPGSSPPPEDRGRTERPTAGD